MATAITPTNPSTLDQVGSIFTDIFGTAQAVSGALNPCPTGSTRVGNTCVPTAASSNTGLYIGLGVAAVAGIALIFLLKK